MFTVGVTVRLCQRYCRCSIFIRRLSHKPSAMRRYGTEVFARYAHHASFMAYESDTFVAPATSVNLRRDAARSPDAMPCCLLSFDARFFAAGDFASLYAELRSRRRSAAVHASYDITRAQTPRQSAPRSPR